MRTERVAASREVISKVAGYKGEYSETCIVIVVVIPKYMPYVLTPPTGNWIGEKYMWTLPIGVSKGRS